LKVIGPSPIPFAFATVPGNSLRPIRIFAPYLVAVLSYFLPGHPVSEMQSPG